MRISLSEQSMLKSFVKFVSWLWILLFLIQSNSVYYVSYNTNVKKMVTLFSLIVLIASFFIIILAILLKQMNIIRLILSVLIFVIIFIFFYWGSSVTGAEWTSFDIYTYWILLLIFFLWNILLKKLCLENYLFVSFKKIVLIYAELSLFMWVGCSVFSIFHTSNQILINWGSIHAVPIYFHLYAQSQDAINFLGINFIRNTGFFAEAPMYSFVLSIALLINVFIENKFNLSTFILMLTIFTTASTTGTLTILIILVIKLNQYLLKSKYRNILLPLIFLVILFGTAFFAYITFLKFEQGSGSVSVRINDFEAGYKTWIQHPIFGVGMSNDIEIIKNMNPARWFYVGHIGNTGYSSGFMKFLAGGGIMYVFLYLLVPILFSMFMFIRHRDIKWAIPMTIAFLLIISLVNNLFLFIYIISWMWSNIFYEEGKA